MRKLTVASLLFLMVAVLLMGCNMARGVGKDLQDTGEHLENIGE